jgi:hypothetical protein
MSRLPLRAVKAEDRTAGRWRRLFRRLQRRGESSHELLPPPSPNRKTDPFVASLVFQGIPIDIEQRKGDTREGVGPDGTPWKVTMRAHYGEVRSHARGAEGVMGARGMDGDRLDVYVGDDLDSDVVVVVDQRIPETGEHDEQKVMLGFSTVEEALDCYRSQYTKPGFYGGHTVMTVDEFRRRIADPASAGQRLEKALSGVAWCPLSPLLGALLFRGALSKGTGRYVTPDGAEVIALHVLTKAGQRAVKYIKRWKVNGRWRYAYARVNAAGRRAVAEHHFDTTHMHEGSSWQLHDGHYTVTEEHGPEVTISRDGGKTTERVSKDELRRRAMDHHREAIEAHRAQKERELEDLRKYGTARQKAAAGLYGFPVQIPKDEDASEWGDVNARDIAVLDSLSRAASLAEIETTLRGVKHREFAVALNERGEVLGVGAGPLHPSSMANTHRPMGGAHDSRVSLPELPSGVAIVVISHNHAAGTPVSRRDVVTSLKAGAKKVRAVTWYGTWEVDTDSVAGRSAPQEFADSLHWAVVLAWSRAASHDLTRPGAASTMEAPSLEVAHDIARQTIEEISLRAGRESAEQLRFELARRRLQFEPIASDGSIGARVPRAAEGEVRSSAGGDERRPDGRIRKEPGADPLKRKLVGDLQAVGDHIWGSRKDLANLGRIESSKQLEGMSYADAAAIVTKAKLVTPLNLEDARALGMEPAVAHLFMYLLSTVRAKPNDTAASRAAFVDEIREIQGAMRRVKTLEDFKALRSEMVSKWRSAPKWVRSPHAAGIEYPMLSKEARAEAERLTRETGVKHRVNASHANYRSWIEMETSRPYESLGTRFVNTLTGSTPGARRDLRAAFVRAQELVNMGHEAAWDALRAGPATPEPPKTKGTTTPKPNTDRGHSTAKSESAAVVRIGGRPVADANPARVRSTFNLREVDFGQAGYMTQADREHHAKQLEGALHDLVDVLGLAPAQVSFHGRLGVALGARGRGKAAAHYEPGRDVINITKFAGGGALAHEWAHALDNIIAGHYVESTIGSAKGDTFLTRNPSHSALPEGLRAAASNVVSAMSKVPPELIDKWKTASRRVDVVEIPRQKRIDELNKAIEQAQSEAAALARSGSGSDREIARSKLNSLMAKRAAIAKLPEDASQYAVDAAMLDNRGRRYWSTPEEMFARAFESYVHDKLAESGRKNTYLTDQRGANAGWYPQGEERRRINREMDSLIAYLRTSGDLQKAMNRMLNTSSPEPFMSASAALWALIKAKYKRKIPTGKFRKTKSGKPGAQIFRYVYTDEAAARGAEVGEHVNFQRKGGVHEVTNVDHDGVTLKHTKSGQEKRLTHAEFHAHLASAYRKEFDRGAEALIRRYVTAAGKLRADPSDPKATLGELRERFKAAGVEPEHAKRLVVFLAGRPGWHTDAKRTLLALASDPTVGRGIAPRAKQIARGAENLSRAEGAEQVEERHVGRAIVLRAPGGGFDEKLADLRHRAAMELAHTEALLGAVEAASGNEAMKRVMVDHAEQAMKSDAGQELEQMVTAYPGLRDLPEFQRLQVARAKWQAIQAERGAQRAAGKDGIPGAATTVYVADADGNPTPQRARYRLIEADAAIASHDPIKGFAVRKDYPEGVQERSYHRDKAEQEKVRRNAQGLKPAYIVNTNPDAVNGPPVMTRDGIVLGGNSRTMSLQLAYHAHPDVAQGYRDYLREHAHEFGLAHTDLDGFKAPILVREVDVEDQGKANLGVLVRRYNESFTQGMDPRVDQVARGRMVTQGMLDSVASGMGRTNAAGEPLYGTLKEFLGSSDGMRFVSDLSSSREGKAIIDRRNRSQYVGKDGKLNEDGKTFVERVLVGHVIPDPDLLSDMLPKHVSAIAGAVPHVVSAAANGHDVKAALKTALDAYSYMRRKDLSNVGEYERDSGGFASLGVAGFEQKPKLDAISKGLLGVLVDRIDKPVQLAGFFREFAKQARANPAGQANLLGESADTATLLDQAARRSKTGQVDMFSKAITWVPLSDSFGQKLWGAAILAKGGASLRNDAEETRRLPWWAALAFDPAGLYKAVAPKYIKRVPTGNPKRPWRYFYKVQHGGGVANTQHFTEGASFAHGDGLYTIHGVKDGKLTVSHSSRPKKTEKITHEELAKRLHEHHRAAIAAHEKATAERLKSELAAARKHGSPKHVQRILDEMKRRGISPSDPSGAKPWEEWGPRPKHQTVDFTGHPLAHELEKLPPERFMTVTVKKVGKEVGRGDQKKVYGNAKVQAQVVFGFDYGQMLRDSYKALDTLPERVRAKALKSYGWEKGEQVRVTEEHFEQALAEIRASLERSLAGPDPMRESGLRPLEVDGRRVPGAYVYRGDETNYTGPKSNPPEPGTIYLHAVHVHSTELEPAENGEWQTRSGPVTVAKQIIDEALPRSTYVSYRLNPGQDWKIRVSGREITVDDIRKQLAKDGIEVPMKKARWNFGGDRWDPTDPLSATGEIIPGPDGIVDLGDLLTDGKAIEKGGTWVELAPALGEAIWTNVLAKGASVSDGVVELPEWAAQVLDPGTLAKAGAPKYIKRVPTGNPKRPWRYFYKVQHGGGVHGVHDFKEGATFADSAQGAGRGHYQIHSVKDGKLAVSHSSDPSKIEHLTHDELSQRLQAHHDRALREHKAKLEREHAEARAAGNHAGAAKIREEAKRIGHEIPMEAPKESKGRTAHREAPVEGREDSRELADIKSKHGEDIHAAVEERVRKEGLSPDVALARERKKRAAAAAKEAAKPPEKPAAPSSSSSSPASVDEHLDEAAKTYGLNGKERDRLDGHEYVKKAREHSEAGEHVKAGQYIRFAVKDVLARNPERNMSPSSAERHMKKLEAAKSMAKALRAFVSLWKGRMAA